MLKWIEKFKPLTRFRIALVLALIGTAPVMWTASAALVPGGSGDVLTVVVFIASMVAEWGALTVLIHAAGLLSAANRQLESIVEQETGTDGEYVGEGEWLPSDQVDWLNPGDTLHNKQTGEIFRQFERSRNQLPHYYRIRRAADPRMPEVLYADELTAEREARLTQLRQAFRNGRPIGMVRVIGDDSGEQPPYMPPIGKHRQADPPAPEAVPDTETTVQTRLFTHGDLFSNRDA